MTRRQVQMFIALMVVAAFLVRVTWIVVFDTYVYHDRQQAGQEMGAMAANIADGLGLSLSGTGFSGDGKPAPTAWFGPVYPYFLAIFFWWFGSYSPQALLAGQVANSAVASLTLLPLFALTRRLFDWKVAIVACVGWTVFPQCIGQATNLWLANVLTFVLFGLLWCVQRCRDHCHWRSYVLAGICLAIAMLTDGVVMGLVPLIVVWLAVTGWPSWRKSLAHLAILLASTLVCLAPWLVRNYRVFGSWVPVRTSLGLNLYIGNNPDATGTYQGARDLIAKQTTSAEQESLMQLDEYQYSELLGARARDWIVHHPAAFAWNCLKRVFYYWLPEARGLENLRGWVRVAFAAVLLAVGGFGFVMSLGRPLRPTILHWTLVFYPVGYYLTVSSISRYRYPMIPLLIVFMAVAAVRLYQTGFGRTLRR